MYQPIAIMTATFEYKDHGKKRILNDLDKLVDAFVMVGFPGNGNKAADGLMDVAQLAAIHEFGTRDGKIKSRPFIKQTYTDSTTQKRTKQLLVHGYKKILRNEMSVKKALGRVGNYFEGQMKKQITEGDFISNSSATVARKGSSKPLIDTGIMRMSITHKVVMK